MLYPRTRVDQIILHLLVRNGNLNGFAYVRKRMVFDQNDPSQLYEPDGELKEWMEIL